MTTTEYIGQERLTTREREVLHQLAVGRTTKEVAGLILLSPHTVRCHVKSAMRKLGARTRPQAVAIAIAAGEFDPRALDVAREPAPPLRAAG